jgi:hypothetical protein
VHLHRDLGGGFRGIPDDNLMVLSGIEATPRGKRSLERYFLCRCRDALRPPPIVLSDMERFLAAVGILACL